MAEEEVVKATLEEAELVDIDHLGIVKPLEEVDLQNPLFKW